MIDEKKKEEDFLDFDQIKDEVQDGPSEEEFTKALDKLSDTDRDIFDDTGIIHVDRDMPAETQAMHVIDLQKKNNQRRNHIVKIILGFMLVGLVVAIIGICIKQVTQQKETPVVSTNETDTQDSTQIAIDEATFPDMLFRTYILKSFDKNQDNVLSNDEIQSVIMIKAPEDTSLTSLQGISNFTKLQSLTFSNTGVTEVDLSHNTDLTFVACNNTPITTLTLPQDSKITTIESNGTNLSCTQNDSKYYQSCTYITQ